MKLCVAGAAGAFSGKHIEALAAIEGVEVVSVVGGAPDEIERFAKEKRIPYWTKDLGESLARKDVEAVVLATPTPFHAA
jgi:2-hydroxy-4-carboxymuconate semialdehyde hemiacetal dehydrogenase